MHASLVCSLDSCFMTKLGNIWPQTFMLNKYFENIYVFKMMYIRVKSRHKG